MQFCLLSLALCLVVANASGKSFIGKISLGRFQKAQTRVRRGASNADIAITQHNNRKMQTLLRQLYLHRLLENMTKRGTTSVPSQNVIIPSSTKSSGSSDDVYRIIDYKRDLMSRVQDLRALVGEKWLSSLEPLDVERLLTSGENLREPENGETTGYQFKSSDEVMMSPYEDHFDYVPVSYDLVE